MSNRPTRAHASATMVLEVMRTAEGGVRLVVSLPGRDGTMEHQWPAEPHWEDLEGRVLSILSNWLLVSGGIAQRLDLDNNLRT